MKTVPLKVGGRTFALAFTLNAMCEMQDKIQNFDLNKLSDYVKTPDGLLDLLVIMARQGESLNDRELDVDREWFGKHLSPSPRRMTTIQIALLNALAEGMRMDTEDDEEFETDEVLNDIKKKETADG